MKQNFQEFLLILFALKCRSFELILPKIDEIRPVILKIDQQYWSSIYTQQPGRTEPWVDHLTWLLRWSTVTIGQVKK